jgi:hypothetical protein
MKRVMCLIGMCMLLVGVGTSSIAEEKKEVGYEVTFTITYNEVDKSEVGELIQNVINKHHKACSVRFDVNKVGTNGNITTTDITTTDIGSLTIDTIDTPTYISPTYTLEYK